MHPLKLLHLRCHLVDGLAHSGEYFGVRLDEVLPGHALLPGEASHKNDDVGIIKRNEGIGSSYHVGEGRVGTVKELHLRRRKRFQGMRYLQKA